jgi:hypothetical protein
MPRLIVHGFTLSLASGRLAHVTLAFFSNTLKYSSNGYHRPHLLPVISCTVTASPRVAFQIFAPELRGFNS